MALLEKINKMENLEPSGLVFMEDNFTFRGFFE
jgi:hypothetical protein